jgi:hypothetical protein
MLRPDWIDRPTRGTHNFTRSDDQHDQFRGVDKTFAIFETQHTQDTDSFCSRYSKETSTVDHRLHLDQDKSLVGSDVILYPAGDKVYTIMLRIKTNTHWRARW